MFYGEFEHVVDVKNRVMIPSKFREIFKDRFVERFFITEGLDKCLFVFTEEQWKAEEKKFRDLSFTSVEARAFNRRFFGSAYEVDCDKQGRILIPEKLKTRVEIKSDVVFVGVSNRIEIWAKEKWQNFFNANEQKFEELAEKLAFK